METLRSFVALFALSVFMASMASSEAYFFYVGGRDGWVLNPSESYSHWAERNRFQVNDSLVFKYKKGEDSVFVVREEDFDKCNVSNPVERRDTGSSVFTFNRSGPFFFISGVEEKCLKGEKLVVVVLAVRSKSPVSPSPSPSPVSPSPSTSPVSPVSPAPSHSPVSPVSPTPSPAPSSRTSPVSPTPSPAPPKSSPVSPTPSPAPSKSSPVSPTPSPSPSHSSSPASPSSPPPTSTISAPSPSAGASPGPSPDSSSSVSIVPDLGFGVLFAVLGGGLLL